MQAFVILTFKWSIWSGVEYHLIFNFNFNLSVFELVGFKSKLFKDLWYIYFHAVRVFSMFVSSLDLCSVYCAYQFCYLLQNLASLWLVVLGSALYLKISLKCFTFSRVGLKLNLKKGNNNKDIKIVDCQIILLECQQNLVFPATQRRSISIGFFFWIKELIFYLSLSKNYNF